MQDEVSTEKYRQAVAHWKANAVCAVRSKRESQRWLRRYKAKAKGRGETIRRFLREPARCAYCGMTCGLTREALAHHVVNCEQHPANRMALFVAALLQAFDLPNEEWPHAAILRKIELAVLLLRKTGGELQCGVAQQLQRFATSVDALLGDDQWPNV